VYNTLTAVVKHFSIDIDDHKEALEAWNHWKKEGKNISDIVCTLIEGKRRAEISAEQYGGITPNEAFLGTLTPEEEEVQQWQQELRETEDNEYNKTLELLKSGKESPERIEEECRVKINRDPDKYFNNKYINKEERERRIKEQRSIEARLRGIQRANREKTNQWHQEEESETTTRIPNREEKIVKEEIKEESTTETI
jgi:hypothetical protein